MENDNLQTVVDLTQKLARPITDEPLHFAVVPEGCRVVSLEDFQHAENPIRKRQVVTMYDVASFAAYYNLFRDGDSRIFADPAKRTFHAVLDYHEAGAGNARFCSHRVSLACKTTEEWEIWTTNNNKQMEQTAFAIFIEDNAPDITRPSGAVMLEVARSLKAKKDVDFLSDIDLTNGSVRFRYNEVVQGRVGGGEMEVPETFGLTFPVLVNSAAVEIEARLRWRVTSEKKLVFWYTLVRARKLLDASFADAVSFIQLETETQVLFGSIEPGK